MTTHRLPTPGSDDGAWGTILNDFLTVEHNPDGTLKASGSLANKANDSAVIHTTGNETVAGTKTFSVSPVVPIPTLGSQATNKTYVDSTVSTGAPDASTTTKGLIQLTGDLAGTATAPTVPGLTGKEPTITAGTTGQYYRGDKSWQTLDKTAAGLPNVDNTSDTNKPISTATQTALNAKLAAASNLSDVASAPTARTNLGLGTAATISSTAGGDLSGTLPTPTVAKVNGVAVTGTPTSGQVIAATSSTAAAWSTPAAAPVTSVAGKTGVVTLTASDTGAVPTTDKGAANGVATLDGTTHIPTAQLPDLSATYAATSALTTEASTARTNEANASFLTTGTVADARLPTTAQAATLSSTFAPLARVACRVFHTDSQSIPTAAITFITWGGQNYDTHGFHSTTVNPSRLTIPAGQAGLYAVGGCWCPAAPVGTAATRAVCQIAVNGATVYQAEIPGGVYSAPTVFTDVALAAGDYVQFAVYQTSGGNITLWNTSTSFSLHKVSL